MLVFSKKSCYTTSMNKAKNVIYGLYDPPELGGNLRYIGQSAQGLKRAYEHKKPGKLKTHNHKVHWILQLISRNKKYKVEILRDLGEFEDPKVRDTALNDAEIELIAHYRSLGVKLTNSTIGGEGTRGNVLSEESKKLISDKRQLWLANNELPKHLWETCYRRKEHRTFDGIEQKHCSDCDTFKPLTEYYSSKTLWDGLESICKVCGNIRLKARRAKNHKILSPEQLAKSYEERTIKMAASIKKKYEDPVYAAKVAKSLQKPIIATNVNNSFDIMEFESAKAAKDKGFINTRISTAISQNRPYKGYYWKFK